jgi:dTDP-4-amino-4,6-dideoxygalactose transaminase
VIVPSFTFVGTVHALCWLGLTPVFCDIDPHSHNIDPQQIGALITDRTTAIVGVHLWGRPCDVGRLGAIAEKHGLRLLFDAAHGLGCALGKRMIGTFGDAEVLSFHATKVANAFEGGVITTNDAAIAARARLLCNFGFVDEDLTASEGINGKMSEASAAMGLTSLDSLDTFIETNQRNAAAYRRGLAELPGVTLLAYDDRQQHNHHYVVLEIDGGVAGINRDLVQRILRAENVLARRYFFPGCHRLEPYRTLYPTAGQQLPQTEAVAARVLQLPTGTMVGIEGIDEICAIVRFVIERGAEITSRIGNTPLAVTADVARDSDYALLTHRTR